MISAFHLIWIIPLAGSIGALIMAFVVASAYSSEMLPNKSDEPVLYER